MINAHNVTPRGHGIVRTRKRVAKLRERDTNFTSVVQLLTASLLHRKSPLPAPEKRRFAEEIAEVLDHSRGPRRIIGFSEVLERFAGN